MNIVTCIKQVPDTAAKVELTPDGKGIQTANLALVLNPYDEYAVEEALKLREKFGGTVTLVTMGPKRADEALRTGLAMGADKGIHVCDEALEDADSMATARVLSAVLSTVPFDIVLCGKVSVDTNNGQVGQMTAEFLGIPHVTAITKLELKDGRATAQKEVEGGKEVVETPLPALFTAEKDLNKPRYPSLPGIMKARQKEVKLLDLKALGNDPGLAGGTSPLVRLEGLSVPPKRAGGKVIQGEPAEAVKTLATALHQEAKVI